MAAPLTVRAQRGKLGNYDGATLGVLLVDATGAADASTLFEFVADVVANELDDAGGYLRGELDVIVDQDGEIGLLKADPEGTPPVFDTTGTSPGGIWLYDKSGGSDAADKLLIFLPVAVGSGFADWEPGWPVLARWLLEGTVVEGDGSAAGPVTITPVDGVADLSEATAAAVFVNGTGGLTEITMPDAATTGSFFAVIALPEGDWEPGTVAFTDDVVEDWTRDGFWYYTAGGFEAVRVRFDPSSGASDWTMVPLPFPHDTDVTPPTWAPQIINTDGDPGTTIYVGTTDPTGSYSPVDGDVWLDTTP